MPNCVCILTKISANVCTHLYMCTANGFSPVQSAAFACGSLHVCFLDGPMAPLQGQVGISVFEVCRVSLALHFLASISLLFPPGSRPFLPDTQPCYWSQCWSNHGRIQTPIPICLSDYLAHLGPCTPTFNFTWLSSHPAPVTLRAQGPGRLVQRAGAWVERLDSCRGEALSAPWFLGVWVVLGKPKQRLTVASFPPWAALASRHWACLGSLWGPLLFPVLAVGLLASQKQAGSRAGYLSHPIGWRLKARAITTLSGRSTQCSCPIL